MKYLNKIKIVFLFTFLLIITSCEEKKALRIITQTEKQKDFFKNIIEYNQYDVKITDNGNYLIIRYITFEMIVEIFNILKLKSEVIADNIANENTTRTANGGPYKRQYIKVSAENGLEIIEDTITPLRLVYDPSHPDSKKDGALVGYVEYPNIDVTLEMVDLRVISNQLKSIIEYINKNYKDVIIF
jgi:flagellar basal-body rod protein FlgC